MLAKRSVVAMPTAQPKRYIGDSVYVEWTGHHLVLTTENGLGPSNTIMLEPEVWAMLEHYVQQIVEANRKRAGTIDMKINADGAIVVTGRPPQPAEPDDI
jgi:hypothetical protein